MYLMMINLKNSKVEKGKQGGGSAIMPVRFAENYGVRVTRKPSAT